MTNPTDTAGPDRTYRYDINRDGIADLALPNAMDDELRAALDDDHEAPIREEIETEVNKHLSAHGIDPRTGEWLGEWSTVAIVRAALDRAALDAAIVDHLNAHPGQQFHADQLRHLAPVTEQPTYAYRHELDDMDDPSSQPGFGGDVAGGATATGRTEVRPDGHALLLALMRLAEAGRIARHQRPGWVEWSSVTASTEAK